MLVQSVLDAINKQINNELSASYSYLAMAVYCESRNFLGCAKWLRFQSQEEYAHAIRLLDFVLARNGQISLGSLPEPATHFASVVAVFEHALAQEREVSRQIDALYALAFQEKAFAALPELEWFLTEQVEEEKTAREIVAKFQMVKDDPAAQLDLDRELGARPAPAAE